MAMDVLLLNADVPSFELCEKKGSRFTLYRIELAVLVNGREEVTWAIQKRFREFDDFHESLKRMFRPILRATHLSLPSKKYIGRFDSSFIEQRRLGLEFYVKEICAHPEIFTNDLVVKFLEIDKHFPSILTHFADEAKEKQQNILENPFFATSVVDRVDLPYEGPAHRTDDSKSDSKKVGSRIAALNASNMQHYENDPFIVTLKYSFVARNELELTVVEGETVRVLHRDGLFLKVKNLSDRCGFVPINYLEVHPSALALYPGPPLPACPRLDHEDQHSLIPNVIRHPEHTPSVFHCSAVAICEFRAEDSGEIDLLEGDVIHVHEVDEESGWWQGTVGSRTGSFPGGYVALTELSHDAADSSPSSHSDLSRSEGWEDGEWVDDDWEEGGEWEQGEIVEGPDDVSPAKCGVVAPGSTIALLATPAAGPASTPSPSPSPSSPSLSIRAKGPSTSFRKGAGGRASPGQADNEPNDNVTSFLMEKSRKASLTDHRTSPKTPGEKREMENPSKFPPPRPFREKRVPVPPNPKGDATRIISQLYRNGLSKPSRPPPVPPPSPSALSAAIPRHPPSTPLSPTLMFVPLE